MDAAEFKGLILSHYKIMYRVALSIVKNVDDAQDITQEAVTRLWEKRDTLANIENAQAFCLIVIKRQCIDFIRSANPQSVPVEEQISIISDEDTESQLVNKDNINNVTKLVEQLPENQKKVIQLRYFGDCTMEEIEQITGLSGVNIRTLLSRARNKIKELYKKAK